jgi:plasmid stabilization system protein ParE
MASIIWSPQAAADVQRLFRFLQPKNADAARRAVQAIRGSVKILAVQPHLGRPVADMPVQYRDWLVDFGNSGYVLRYRLDAPSQVLILAVRHQKETAW